MGKLDRDLLLGGVEQSDEQRWKLVTSLFRQPRSLAASGIGTLAAAVVCFRQTGSSWFLIWGVIGCGVLGLRMALALTFSRIRQSLAVERWAWLFLLGASATAFVAGVGAAATVIHPGDLVAGPYMATNVISFAGGAAVRNNASPLAARCQTTIALGLPGVACLCSGIPYLECFAILILLHLVAQYEIIRALGRSSVWLITAERRQASLNEQLSRTCKQLEIANGRLTQLSSTDGLTGLSNRRAFDTELGLQWKIASGAKSQLALLMIDADHFKLFNDKHGHIAGDDALRWIAQVLRATLHRPSDFVGRYGGEEFAVLLPDTDELGAIAAGERLRKALAQAEIPAGIAGLGRLTVSIGAAAMAPHLGVSCLSLVEAADEALYAATHCGRNRVAVKERRPLRKPA